MRMLSIAALFVCLAVPARAQDAPRFTVSGGWSMLYDEALDMTFLGFYGSASGKITPVFGVSGEVSGNWADIEVGPVEVAVSVYSFMIGPEIAAPSGRVIPYAQFLIGGVRGSASVFGESGSVTNFALQPAGGVDIWLSDSIGIRGSAYLRRVFFEIEARNEIGFMAGIVIGGGR